MSLKCTPSRTCLIQRPPPPPTDPSPVPILAMVSALVAVRNLSGSRLHTCIMQVFANCFCIYACASMCASAAASVWVCHSLFIVGLIAYLCSVSFEAAAQDAQGYKSTLVHRTQLLTMLPLYVLHTTHLDSHSYSHSHPHSSNYENCLSMQ